MKRKQEKSLLSILSFVAGMALLLACSGCVGSGEKPVVPEEETAAKGFEGETVTLPAEGQVGENYAVCIGISNYDNLPNLKFAHRDAEDVYDFLISDAGGYDMNHCALLCDSNAQGSRVLREDVERLFTTWMAKVRPEDTVFIFFSGHGVPEGRDRAYLATSDTNLNNLYPTSIPMNRIREYLDLTILSERVVIVMDTCFSGSVKSCLPSGQRGTSFDEGSLGRVVKGKGRVILSACSGRQAAHEVEELGHGIFTWCLLNGLRGEADLDRDRTITLSELWLFLQKTVPRESGRLGWRQTPVRKGDESGQMVLARLRSDEGSERPAAMSGKATEVWGWILEGTRLMTQGFHETAMERFRKAMPHVPLDRKAEIAEIIAVCERAVARKRLARAQDETDSSAVIADQAALSLAGTLAESDFLTGRKAEEQEMWGVAIELYSAALTACPEEHRAVIEDRIDHCRMEERSAVLYEELTHLFDSAEAAPSQAGYGAVLEKGAELEVLGKGSGYREFGFIRSRADAEDTSDDSRKYFGWGERYRDSGNLREAIRWFEKAREGAGGRYPAAIEENLGFCRFSLKQRIARTRSAAEEAFSDRRFEECSKECDAWSELEPKSAEAAELRLRAVRARAGELFESGKHAHCREYAREELENSPGDVVLTDYYRRAGEEDIPPGARAAWERAVRAEEAEDWVAMADALKEGMDARDGEGFNAHYRVKAGPKFEEARVKAYAICFNGGQAAMEAGELVQALRLVERSLVYRTGFQPAISLKKEIEKMAEKLELQLFQAAVEKEKGGRCGDFITARNQAEKNAVAEALAAYQEYLDQYPDGKWKIEAREARIRLEEKKLEIPEGFAFLREETFTCGGEKHTVRIYEHGKTGLEFVLIPAGSFTMGRPSGVLSYLGNLGRYESEDPPHEVRVKPFLLCRTECSQAVWDRIGGSDFRTWKGAALPIEQVSWKACTTWCHKAGLRLPTEAEWEYACRAGTRTRFCFGDSDIRSGLREYAWYAFNSDRRPHYVAQKKPNAFGLFDMHGNVWEWCQDKYHHGYLGAPSDGSAWEGGAGTARIKRGGSFKDREEYCRSAWRHRADEGRRSEDTGFRPAASLP